jgi:hypothetical protein
MSAPIAADRKKHDEAPGKRLARRNGNPVFSCTVQGTKSNIFAGIVQNFSTLLGPYVNAC